MTIISRRMCGGKMGMGGGGGSWDQVVQYNLKKDKGRTITKEYSHERKKCQLLHSKVSKHGA